MLNTKSTYQLYDAVIALIDESLQNVLKEDSRILGNEDLQGAISSSRRLLEAYRDKTKDAILELREIAEWVTFTMVFYGETNAGKSTLIETLRILLEEPQKVDAQLQFRALAQGLPSDSPSTHTLDNSITQLAQEITEHKTESEDLEQKLFAKEQQQYTELGELKAAINLQRQHFNLLQKLVYRFKKLEAEKILETKNRHLAQVKRINKATLEARTEQLNALSKQHEKCLAELARVEKLLKEMMPLQDGNIIGNGRSDFTLKAQAYRFASADQEFQLIDVPGIEGDEKQVMGDIEPSVKKAHVVFYVTRDASPPGSGSEGQEGTIDKIRRHLGMQTEVWTIFNKSVNNPQGLQGERLVSPSDALGLLDMDKALSHALGVDTYKGHICLSGMPSFLAAASCLLPNSPHARAREKFLAKLESEEILERSGMKSFLQFIRSDIQENFKMKIRDANHKKVSSCLEDGINHVRQARDSFAAAAQKLRDQQSVTEAQIDSLLDSISRRFRSECQAKLRFMKEEARKAIYVYIAEGPTNNDFQERLNVDIEELKAGVGPELKDSFSKVLQKFRQEAEGIIAKHQKNVDEILDYTINSPFSSQQLHFNGDFKMASGVDGTRLTTALIAAVLMLTGPSAPLWVTVIAAATFVLSLYKSVSSSFSKHYRQQQQRKAADNNLDKFFKQQADTLDEHVSTAKTTLGDALEGLKEELGNAYLKSAHLETAFDGICTQMVALRENLTSSEPLSAPARVTAKQLTAKLSNL